jgi:hypothetical protein
MVGALLVLVGMVLFLWGGIASVIEATDPVFAAIETRSPGGFSQLLLGAAVTLAGGVVLLLSSPRRLA